MFSERKIGFDPVYDENSKVLILGSFPSVKSREIDFYYGHKQNRFWKMLYGYFGETVSEDTAKKKTFLLNHGIALWDMVVSCEIVGSADATVKNPEIADLQTVLNRAKIQKILLNGSLAYSLFLEKYKDLGIPYAKMPSTSSANPRYDVKVWWGALDGVF